MTLTADDATRTIRRGAAVFRVALPEKLDRDYWAKVADERWEPETFRLFDAALGQAPGAGPGGPPRRLVDIGAWIGPTALYAAALGASVDAFEPDPVALGKLRANLALNPDLAARIAVHPVALAPAEAAAKGTVELATEEAGNSMSGLFRDAPERLTVAAATPDAAGLPALFETADLVKLDIEGGEFALLPALAPLLAASRPVLHLSLHARFLPEARLGAAERGRLQRAALAALPDYAHAYQARRGVWSALAGWRDALATRIAPPEGERGLDGAFAFADRPLAILD
ncbi:MAG: FkbM family methyltransferase [Alphaproteobacteria bacterium]|nr:FkbM family methyltransferase [Alphaproteobacteria bacterium]